MRDGPYTNVQSMKPYSDESQLCNKDLQIHLFTACFNGDLQSVQYLIGLGVKIDNEITEETPDTLLHVAAEHGHFETVKELVLCGANVHTRNSNGDTPIICAVKNEHELIFDYF